MYIMDSSAMIAHLLVEQKLREAERLYQGRELQQSSRATETSPVEAPRQHSRMWSLVHFRHAFG